MNPRALFARVGLTGLAIAILVVLLIVQTVRLEGLKVWPINIEGAGPKAERLQRTIDEIDRAQDDALAAAELAKARAEADYRNLAERIDDEALEAHADARTDAERYIAANRVRCPTDRGTGGGTTTAPGDSGAGSSTGAGSAPVMDAGVLVSEEDIFICTVNTVQAEEAREWALELMKPSLP